MRTRLVPHAEWFDFFEQFTRRHTGWPTTLWLLSPRIGAQVEARELPLRGIASDPLATSISIQLGGTPDGYVEHPLDHPTKVWLNESDEGEATALGINSTDGITTLLEFHAPVPQKVAEPGITVHAAARHSI
jgi:hypothetical protein